MQQYKTYFVDKKFITSFFFGLILLALSLVTQFFVTGYVNKTASVPVTDIILSNTNVHNVGDIFVWGSVILAFIGIILCLKNIKYTPFLSKSIAVFTLIRAVFVSLTHISPFPTHVIINSVFFNKEAFTGIFNGNDLFFSGHTGVPFLLALIFWKNKVLRIIFLCFSFMFAAVVLLGHLHYSIDVLSAYFITFSIFHICVFIFKKDWETLNSPE